MAAAFIKKQSKMETYQLISLVTFVIFRKTIPSNRLTNLYCDGFQLRPTITATSTHVTDKVKFVLIIILVSERIGERESI